MGKKRQDSWTSDEDILLAETVLRYIRQGNTQLAAFKEAAHILSRTAAACGFRWNATLRKQYVDSIALAQKMKQHLAHVDPNSVETEVNSREHNDEIVADENYVTKQTDVQRDVELSIDKTIALLEQWKKQTSGPQSERVL